MYGEDISQMLERNCSMPFDDPHRCDAASGNRRGGVSPTRIAMLGTRRELAVAERNGPAVVFGWKWTSEPRRRRPDGGLSARCLLIVIRCVGLSYDLPSDAVGVSEKKPWARRFFNLRARTGVRGGSIVSI